jgi:Zn-dependent protease with chaperone function
VTVDVDGYLPLVLPAVAAVAAGPLAERLPPRTASWVLTALAAGLAGASVVPLLALALGDPLAALLVAAAVAGAAAAACGQARALRSARRWARALPGAGLVAVVADDRIDAYSVPGRVVVSTGMLAALAPDERRVLFAHEAAHLSGRHHLFRAVVRVASAANPLLWPMRRALWYATERWADERAAAAVGDRVLAARVIGKVALASSGAPAARMGIGGARPGPVPRRVAALLRPPPRRGVGLTAAALGLLLCSGLSAQDLVDDAGHPPAKRVVVAAHARR